MFTNITLEFTTNASLVMTLKKTKKYSPNLRSLSYSNNQHTNTYILLKKFI